MKSFTIARRTNGASTASAVAYAFSLFTRAATVLVCLAPFSAAQGPEVSIPDQSPPSAQVEENMELARLVDLCAAKLQLDVHYESGQLSGTVALRQMNGLSDQELWTLTNRALVSRGLTTIQLPGEETITVVELDEADSLARLEEGDLSKAKAGYAKVLYGLSYASPTDVLPTLQQVMSESGVLAMAVGKSNSMLLADLRPNLDQVFQLLELLDAAPETVTEIPLLHVEPETLVSLVEVLAATRSVVHGLELRGKLLPSPSGRAVLLIAPSEERELWFDMIARMDQRKGVRTLSYAPKSLPLAEFSRLVEEAARGAEAGGLGEGWRLVVDELSDSIVVTATRGQHQKVAELLERIDAWASVDSQPVRVFSIRNRSSMELAVLLNHLVGTGFLSPAESRPNEESNLIASTPGMEALTSPPPATQVLPIPKHAWRGDHGKLSVSADAATNTLFATGDAALLDKLEGLVKTLDVIASQVMLEVLILNLSDTDALDLGVEIRGIKDEGTLSSLTSLFGLGGPDPGAPTSALPSLSGFTGVVLNPGDFSVLLNALRVLNKGRALNIPKVLVNSNQQAKLASVLQTPFLSTNATIVVATTTFGGTQDAGTTIEVRPQIAEGDHLVLEYSIVLSTFVGPASDPSLPPPRQENNLQSVATIPDGYTVALGGLETTSQTEGSSRVPFLGSLPLIGRLFRSDALKSSHSRFFVFIRASILRGSDFQHLRFLSDVEMQRADLGPGWPEVEPALIQ